MNVSTTGALSVTAGAVVAIGLRGRTEIGSTFVSVSQRYAQALQAHDSKLMLVGVEPGVRDQLAKTGLVTLIGEENIFMSAPQLGASMNQAAAAAAHPWLAGASER